MAIEGIYDENSSTNVPLYLNDIGAFLLAISECGRAGISATAQMSIGPSGLYLLVYAKETKRELLNVQLGLQGWKQARVNDAYVIYHRKSKM